MKISRGTSLDRYYLIKIFGFGLFLHKIHHSDPPNRYHTHPWSGLSIIFGSYIEDTIVGPDKKQSHRTILNWIRAKRPHRVTITKPIWTLFFHLPKSNQWKIYDDDGQVVAVEPWKGDTGHKDYLNPQGTKE